MEPKASALAWIAMSQTGTVVGPTLLLDELGLGQGAPEGAGLPVGWHLWSLSYFGVRRLAISSRAVPGPPAASRARC